MPLGNLVDRISGSILPSRPVLQNAVRVQPRNFDQRLGSRLRDAKNFGGVVRRRKTAIDSDRVLHAIDYKTSRGGGRRSRKNLPLSNI